MDVEETAINVRDAIRDVPKKFEKNKDKIKQLELEVLDLLHLVEMTKFNAMEGYKITKRLQEIRQERRKLKDENEELEHIAYLLKDMKKELGAFDNAVGEIRKTKLDRVGRKYRCRVRKDLQKMINGVKSS